MRNYSIFQLLGVLSPANIKRLVTRQGTKVGTDIYGNCYYSAPAKAGSLRERRWVLYAGETEASAIPPEWHGWMHHTVDAPPATTNALRQKWQKPPAINHTGTDAAYLPSGHSLSSQKKPHASGDYTAWQPPQ